MNEEKIKKITYSLTVLALVLYIICFGFLFWALETVSKNFLPTLDASAPGVTEVSILKEGRSNPPPSVLKKEEITVEEISVEDQIRKIAIENNFDPDTAIKIGICESNLDPNAKNKNSTASGIYQFINKTFENYCEGNVFDIKDNTLCFIKLYPKYPHYWVCK